MQPVDEIGRAIENYTSSQKEKIAFNPAKYMPTRENSTIEGTRIVLRNADSKVLNVYSRVTDKNGNIAPRIANIDGEPALAWARAMGYAVPVKPNGCLWVVAITCGLFAAVIPGLLLILFLVIKQRDYEKEVRQLRNKWIDAGKPDPQAVRGS